MKYHLICMCWTILAIIALIAGESHALWGSLVISNIYLSKALEGKK